MSSVKTLRPSPGLIVATAALVMAMSGAAIALPGKNSVQKNDIENGAVTGKKIAEAAVGSKHIKGKSIKGNRIKDNGIKAKQIADGTVTSKQVAADGIDSSNIADYKSSATELLTATDGVDAAAARAAAPKQELFEKGQLSIYGKCFRDTTADEVSAAIFIETSANGAIFDGDDGLSGGPAATDFLNTDTLEEDRELENGTQATAGDANANEGEFMAQAGDGTKLVGQFAAAAKNGNLAGGNGLYGEGNVCTLQVEVAG